MPENAGTRKEIRYDHGVLVRRDSQASFRRYDVKIARAGVFPYVYQDGTTRLEAKLPQDLFSQTTIDSAKGAPITDDHVPPFDSKGLVTPENYQKYVKGSLGDTITVQDGHLCGVETLLDSGLMAKVDSGEKVELSIGFELDIDPTPGEYNGQRYDAIQRNIRINHVAHVDKGRAGETVRVQTDSIPNDVHIAIMKKQGDLMPTTHTPVAPAKATTLDKLLKLLRLDSEDAPAVPAENASTESTPPTAPTVEDLQEQIVALQTQLKAATDQIAKLTTAAEEDAVEDQSEAALDAKIAQRTTLVDTAKIVIPDVKTDGMKDRDIKLKIIAAKLPFAAGVRQDNLSHERINAQFEAAVELARREALDAGVGPDGAEVRNDEKAILDGRKARAMRWDEAEKERAKRK